MAANVGRDRYARQSLGSLHTRIKESRVLMVGAGGIGCELLKNLVLTGFGEIHVIDLDTIDLSNLNRQFLFRHEHIKKSKALVAAETAAKFNPNVKIHPHHANIRDPQFDLEWYRSFALVFNALDNLDARRYVNRMCLAADVPLIESGTTGFNGQVQPIMRPIHCIVWAKSYLFTELFGTSEDDAPELDHSEDADNAEEIAKLREESQALKRLRKSMGSEDFPRQVFNKVFKEDVERLRSMEDMWKTRQPPEVLNLDTIALNALGTGTAIALQDQNVWTLGENYAVFADSMKRLGNRLEEARANVDLGNAQPILTFDKDDEDTLDFVAAAANLRSFVFEIERKSKFDIKQMAGNIIPAIATTNAMTAGLSVLQAFKVLRGDLQKARMVFLTRSTERIITSEPLRPPKPDCAVCGVAQASIQVDVSKVTLKDVVDGLLRDQWGYGEEFSVSSDAGILYDPELDDNLGKRLKELGVEGGSFLVVVDDALENPRVNLVIAISSKDLTSESKPIIAPDKMEIPLRPPTTNALGFSGANGEAVDGITGKRKRDADEAALEEEQTKKRGKVVEESVTGLDDDVVLASDATNGAILIDD
ncbi:MAG: E1 ubiquitin-activating protein uba2 [Bathelium mastoideum]|nr:MAG: E1 ubiquitin-activating protein uba2 [Bathelium mastoideum]